MKLATEDSIPNFKPEVTIKPRRHRPWSEKIHEAIKVCRLRWWEWKQKGASRDPMDPDFIRMRKANRSIRQKQKREAARRRDQQIESIMAAENDTKTFFELVKSQRKTSREQTDKLTVDGQVYESGEEICQAWASHFQKLALPLENENFDSEYKKLVDMDIDSITAICEAESNKIDPVTEDEVRKALSKLKNNKAVDTMGLCIAPQE